MLKNSDAVLRKQQNRNKYTTIGNFQKAYLIEGIKFNTLEVQNFARNVGIDYRIDLERYGWFVKIALGVPLPYPWTREKDPNGGIVYSNQETDELCPHHPLELFFRKTFNKVISFLRNLFV